MVALLTQALTQLLVTVAAGVWPLQPQPDVVRGFHPPALEWGAGHRGVDLLGTPGQPVRTALAGSVSFAGTIAGRGVVVVDHGGTRTTYEPVDSSVSRGDVLVAGQVLGTLAWAGTHCAPRACLHWGLIEGAATYRDPLTLIGCAPGPVRLLPLGGPAPASPGCHAPLPHPGLELARSLLRLVDELAGRPGAAGRR